MSINFINTEENIDNIIVNIKDSNSSGYMKTSLINKFEFLNTLQEGDISWYIFFISLINKYIDGDYYTLDITFSKDSDNVIVKFDSVDKEIWELATIIKNKNKRNYTIEKVTNIITEKLLKLDKSTSSILVGLSLYLELDICNIDNNMFYIKKDIPKFFIRIIEILYNKEILL